MQQSKFLESNTKFNINNPKSGRRFTEDQFFQWSSNNFYRTSYNDMRSRVSQLCHKSSSSPF